MAFRLMRAYLARGTVVAAAFALPLLASASAQAAIAGASPEKTSNRPDLISATLSGGSVEYCFDKTLTNTALTPADFVLGGYRSLNVLPAGGAVVETIATTPANSCVRAAFPLSDLTQYTIATVLPGAVTANGGTAGLDGNNFSDSTPLTGSNTHNGTSGFTIAPDLIGAIVDTGFNQISYGEDQAISTAVAPVANKFYFVDGGGNVCTANAAPTVSGSTVVVTFASDSCSNGSTTEGVSNAVRAGQRAGAVVAANDPTLAASAPNETVVTGAPNLGATSLPDLTGVSLESNQSSLDFTFNKPFAAVDLPGDFSAELSTGDIVPATSAVVIGGTSTSTTVRAQFPFFGDYDEYVVGGSVSNTQPTLTTPATSGAVVVGTGGAVAYNTPGAQPLAPPFGNAGAFATGFTTAPDAIMATGSKSTGVVTVLLDQRAFTNVPGDIQLLDGTGNSVATAAANSVFLPVQTAGQQTITIQFGTSQLATAQNLSLGAGALTNPLSTEATGATPAAPDQPSVAQVLSLAVTSSILHSASLHKTQSRAWIARRDARLEAASKARLARMRQLAAKHHQVKHSRA